MKLSNPAPCLQWRVLSNEIVPFLTAIAIARCIRKPLLVTSCKNCSSESVRPALAIPLKQSIRMMPLG